MARPQLVGQTSAKGVYVSGEITVSLTSLTGGLASAPANGDIIVVGAAIGARSQLDPTTQIRDAAGNNYTAIGSGIYANDSFDTNLGAAYKFAGATPDTSVKLANGIANAAYIIMVEVWRGVNTSTPIDVTTVDASGTNTGRPNPGSITPTSASAEVVCFAAGAATEGSAPTALTSSSFSSFVAVEQQGSTSQASLSCGFGHYDWTSGVFDPAEFGGGSTSTSNSWAAKLIALRPIPNAYSLTASAASFVLTAATAGLLAARKIVAAAGSFALAGTTAGLLRGLRFIVDAGSFTLTGTSAAFIYGRRIVAEAASFVLTGSSASLLAARNIAAGAGVFALSGAATGLSVARKIIAGAGAFVVSSVAAFFRLPPPSWRTSASVAQDRTSRSEVQYRTSASSAIAGSKSEPQDRSSASTPQDRSSR